MYSTASSEFGKSTDQERTRPKAAQALATRYYFYSPKMTLLAETELTVGSGAPAVLYEYIWFNGHPVAQIDSGTATHWTFTDHLGTPILQLTSTASVWWRGEYEPYGRIFSTPSGNQHQPLRLPGQEPEQLSPGDTPNGTTERSYNIFRWYRPSWGRYTQADPITADVVAERARYLGRVPDHLYLYVNGQPTILADPLGLEVQVCQRPNQIEQFQGIPVVSEHPAQVAEDSEEGGRPWRSRWPSSWRSSTAGLRVPIDRNR